MGRGPGPCFWLPLLGSRRSPVLLPQEPPLAPKGRGAWLMEHLRLPPFPKPLRPSPFGFLPTLEFSEIKSRGSSVPVSAAPFLVAVSQPLELEGWRGARRRPSPRPREGATLGDTQGQPRHSSQRGQSWDSNSGSTFSSTGLRAASCFRSEPSPVGAPGHRQPEPAPGRD